MSRDAYGGGGSRSPRGVRLPTVDRSPSRAYHPGGSPLGRSSKPPRQPRSGNNSPTDHSYGYHHSSPYYRDEEMGSPMLEERTRPMSVGPVHHRSRSATRATNPMTVRYQSLDRPPAMDHEREFVPIRDRRDRSLDRGLYFDDEPYTSRSARQSPTSHQPFIGELQHQNSDLQRDLANLKKELELTNQKLGSSMHSIKTFWSPELKKERALRKEESAKYSLINDQLKLLSSENQKQAMLVRQLEEELRMRMRGPSIELQQQMEALYQENEHLTREIAILRDTIKELELRIETQKQTLQARDESIKKLLEMLQNKGMGKEEERQMFQQMQAMAQKQLDEFRVEIQRRDQEILAMGAKMKTLEEQHQDYQRHIAVLKESLCAKEEHYNMLQADVEEMRQRLEEKNRLIEKKTQQHQQERGRAAAEIAEMREHMDIKDRKINVLQRKLELHEAQKKAAAAPAAQRPPGEDLTAKSKQLDEEKKQFQEARRQVEDQRRVVDTKAKQIEEKERALNELDKQLQKQKQQLDQLQASLQKAGGGAAAAGELTKKLTEAEKKVEQAQEEAKRSAAEMERLLQLVQMSQEEQNAKEKQIAELQQALKNAQTKLRSQQQQAQKEEGHDKGSEINESLTTKPEVNSEYIQELENTLESYEKSMKEFKNEQNILETTIQRKNDLINDLEKELASLRDNKNVNHQERTLVISMFEEKNRDKENFSNGRQKIEEMIELSEEKDNRISELEDALRETIKISTEREMVLHAEESKRKQIMEKVSKLEQRLLSLQSAQAMRCHSCRPFVRKMSTLESRLSNMIDERKQHLQELAHMKREALEAAISEKDAHLALLEMTGIRSARQAEEVDRLRMDKRRLVEQLKKESELSISLFECEEEEKESFEDIDQQSVHIVSIEDDKNRHLNGNTT